MLNPIAMMCRLVMFLLLGTTFCLAEEPEAHGSLKSPDGRFEFHAYSSSEADAGSPPFTILETATQKPVWKPDDSLGDASRPEESILWSPDSRRFALTTRISTRRLATFFFQWNGTAFQPMTWESNGDLEAKADEDFDKQAAFAGFSEEANKGSVIADDILPESWLDANTVVLVRKIDKSISEEDSEEALSGSARALLRWDTANKAFKIDHFLPVFPPWPTEWEASDFEIVQEEAPEAGEGSEMKKLTITHKEKNEELSFIAEGKMITPTILSEHNGWPQIELICDGPPEFFWRKLYRVENGAYRCARIDEFTTHRAQAPEGALKVVFHAGYEPYFIQSRITTDEDEESFESFLVEVPSPDKKHTIHIQYNPQYLNKVEVHSSASSDEGQNIFDLDSSDDGGVDSICQVLWRPDSKAFAFYFKGGPRYGTTSLYVLEGDHWKESKFPTLMFPLAEQMKKEGVRWQNRFEMPLRWVDSQTLLMDLFGFFDGDGGSEYHYEATLVWNKKGKVKIQDLKETHPEE